MLAGMLLACCAWGTAMKYPQGLTRAKTLAAVNAPFAPGVQREGGDQLTFMRILPVAKRNGGWE